MHVMIDIETLGTETGSVILAIAAVIFDPVNNVIIDEFFTPVDIGSCLEIGLKIDAGALRFWLSQPQEIRDIVMPEDAPYLEPSLVALGKFLEGCTNFWAYGPMFDIAQLDEACKRLHYRPVWTYRQPRCVRTVLEISGLSLSDFVTNALHDPRADCRQQIEAVHAAYRKLGLVPLN